MFLLSRGFVFAHRIVSATGLWMTGSWQRSTGQRREEVAQMAWNEIDVSARIWHIPSQRSKNAKGHLVHLSDAVWGVINGMPRHARFVFATSAGKNFQSFKRAKADLDRRSGVTEWRLHDLRRTVVTGMARLGIPPHVADKILNHQSGTISGVAAVYQKHEFLDERKAALDLWAGHVARIIRAAKPSVEGAVGDSEGMAA
jgi:integrase